MIRDIGYPCLASYHFVSLGTFVSEATNRFPAKLNRIVLDAALGCIIISIVCGVDRSLSR